MGATALVKVSAAVVYASNSGVKADEVTDNTAAVQATLDGFGSAGTPLEYVFDQPGIVLCAGTIKVWGGQTLRALPGTLLKKAGSSTSNGAPLLQNKHPVAYGAGSQVDQNIILQDLFLDGNRRGGGAGAGGAYPFVNALGYVVPSVVFSGVNSFDIRNVHILDSPSYGLQLSNSANGRVDNFSKFLWPTDTETAGAGDAIIQCQGGTSNVHMYHVFGSAGDDPIAFNANDGNDIPDATITFAPGTVAQGPVTHCSVNDCYFLPNSNGTFGQPGRLLSSNPSSYIDDITFNNVTGWCRYSPFNMDNFGIPLGNGSYDNIRFLNCTYYLDGANPWLNIDHATVGTVVIDGLTLIPLSPFTGPELIRITSNATYKHIKIGTVHLRDPNGYLAGPIAVLGGTGTTLIGDWTTDRGTQATLSQPAISCTGTNTILYDGGVIDRFANVVNVSAGTTTVVYGTGAHTNANGGKSFTQSGGGSITLISGFDSSSIGP